MLKILLVDDKYIVRRCLRECIDWKSNGFEIIGEAAEGNTALEFCKTQNPDIIITDIYMPVMDGLALIRQIQALYPDIEFLILSGYDKFEYARTAMQLGVTAYLLKPVKNDELLSSMLRLKEKIYNKRSLEHSNENSDEIKREMFLLELLNGPRFLSREQVDKLVSRYGITLPNRPYFTINLRLGEGESQQRNPAFYLRQLQTGFYNSIARGFVFLCQADRSSLLALVFADTPSLRDSILRQIDRVKASLTFPISVGASGLSQDFSQFHYLKDQAVAAAKNAALAAKQPVRQGNSSNFPKQETPLLSFGEIKTISKACHEQDTDTISAIIDSYFQKISACECVDLDAVKNRIQFLVLSLMYSISDDDDVLTEVFNRTDNPMKGLSELNHCSEIKNWTLRFIDELLKQPNVYLNGSYSPQVQQIVYYIMLNYAKPITLNSVAQHFFISPQHLLRRFKKETGKTFNSYLTEYRIAKARELLKTGKYKIYEVCEMVGYQDPTYFSKTFKKLTGSNPTHISGPGTNPAHKKREE